jgi:hypothetical protein
VKSQIAALAMRIILTARVKGQAWNEICCRMKIILY